MDKKSLRTSTWIIIISVILIVCILLSVYLLSHKQSRTVANVYVDGSCMFSVDLSQVTESYEEKITYGNDGFNTLKISPGAICVSDANCPDKVCQRSGSISDGLVPIVCLPHHLVVKIEEVSKLGKSIDNSAQPKNSSVIFAMDTVMDITIYGDKSLLEEVENIVMDMESLFSTTNPESEIFRLNRGENIDLSNDTAHIIGRACEISSLTDGALDIFIYSIVREWGFTTGDYKVPTSSQISKLREQNLIDLGSVAKGYTGDRIIEYLKQKGVTNALLNLGGNIQTIGSKPDGSPWRVGIKNPDDTSSYIGYVDVIDKNVITSGDYERFFEKDGKKYHHIIDPHTGFPADNDLRSVTVVGDSGFTCDALSTALFVMGKDNAIAFWKANKDNMNFNIILIDKDGNISVTEGLDEMFTYTGDKKVNIIHD